jgi:hypothetical protein
VFIGIDMGRYIYTPPSPMGLKNELIIANILPAGCSSIDDPACWEMLARSATELGGQETAIGPLRFVVAVDPDKALRMLGVTAAAKAAASLMKLEAMAISFARTEKLITWLLRAVKAGGDWWKWAVLLVVLAIAMAVGFSIMGAALHR